MVKISKPESPKNNGLNLDDLNGSVSNAIVFSDSHFSLESAVWQNAQRIADMLPIDVQVSGDISEETVLNLLDKAKGAELQAKNWTEYSAAFSRYLKAFYKVRQKQAEVAENAGEARLQHAELEKELGTALASLVITACGSCSHNCLHHWTQGKLHDFTSYCNRINFRVCKMLFRWLMIACQGLIALLLITNVNKKTPLLFIPGNMIAIALVSSAAISLRKLEKEYEDIERKEDMLFTLKEVQGEEQLAFLETAAQSRRTHEDADKQMERQLKMLQETAPLFSELLNLTGRNGAIERMALGMLQGGASIGEVLVATADAEIKLEQAKLATQLQHKQIELQKTNSAALQTSVNLENAVLSTNTLAKIRG